MRIALLPAALSERPALANLLQLYLHDLSEYSGSDIDDQGRFAYPYLDSYWEDPTRHPFLIRVNDWLAGFALVNSWSRISNPFDGHAVAEFFVLRHYRRHGVGRKAAVQLFAHFPGSWEVASFAANVPAQAFWRSVIDHYTDGRYDETWVQNAEWRGPVQTFTALPGPQV